MTEKRKPEPAKTYSDGYVDGWHSIQPGTTPGIPAHALSGMKSPYDQGYEAGKAAANDQRARMGLPPKD